MKGRHLHKLFLCSSFALACFSCSKVPGYVIPQSKMASLLADIHIGEAVVDLNRNDYSSDSAKLVMLQSVLAKYGVTKHDLDTSYDWYGHNITYYMEVYDKTIEILEHRLAETGNRIAAENISIAGDSVDVWGAASSVAVNRLSPSQFITFTLSEDENWQPGDSYTWRAKFTNGANAATWAIAADYSDGSKELYSTELNSDGWNELKFISDSTKRATRVYGYLSAFPRGATTLWADSIMLIRNRVSPDDYRHHFRQYRINPKNLIKVSAAQEKNDSIDK